MPENWDVFFFSTDMKEKASIITLDSYYSLKEEEIVVSAEET